MKIRLLTVALGALLLGLMSPSHAGDPKFIGATSNGFSPCNGCGFTDGAIQFAKQKLCPNGTYLCNPGHYPNGVLVHIFEEGNTSNAADVTITISISSNNYAMFNWVGAAGYEVCHDIDDHFNNGPPN